MKEGTSSDETIGAVTPVTLEKGGTAAMSPMAMHIQAAARLPGEPWPFRRTLQTTEGLWEQTQSKDSCAFTVTVMPQLPLDGVTGGRGLPGAVRQWVHGGGRGHPLGLRTHQGGLVPGEPVRTATPSSLAQ